jgi:hypothetical protein
LSAAEQRYPPALAVNAENHQVASVAQQCGVSSHYRRQAADLS